MQYALPTILPDANKYSRGSLLILGGSARYPGAAILAAKAAGRTGAGYTSLAIPSSAAIVAQMQLTSVPVIAAPDADGAFGANALESIKEQVRHINAVVVGPGVTQTKNVIQLLEQLLEEAAFPILLDADALNILAATNFFNMTFSTRHILTPHAGELARLNAATDTKNAEELAVKLGAVVVEKGPTTHIFSPARQNSSSAGTPALAKAGTGDVLSGIIGALLAQGMEPFAAACAGVEIHSKAGRLAEQKYGTRSVIPEDVVDSIAEVLRSM